MSDILTKIIAHLQYQMIVRQFSQPIWERFVDEAYLSGLWKPAAGKTVDDYKEIVWMNLARGHIHPVQEISAYVEAIRAGITSRKRVAAALGEDAEEIDAENARDQQRARNLGLQKATYPALEGMNFQSVLQASEMEDAPEFGGNRRANSPAFRQCMRTEKTSLRALKI